MKKLLLVLTVGLLFSCEPIDNSQNEPVQQRTESQAFKKGKRQLEIQGYTNITETPYPIWCCAEEDSWILSCGFEATDKDGEKVKGCFCVKGLLRNSVTIRFD